MSDLAGVRPQLWERLDRWTNWVVLSRLRNSFLSRAITALSLSSLVLGNLLEVFARTGIDPFTLRLTFAGSLIFLLGYLMIGLWIPPEFGQQGEIYDHVKRMKEIADSDFVTSRLAMSNNLLERVNTWRSLQPPKPLIDFLTTTTSILKEKDSGFSDEEMAALFHADLSLRKHDSPARRLIAASIMMIGVACLALPTLRNVVKAIAAGAL